MNFEQLRKEKKTIYEKTSPSKIEMSKNGEKKKRYSKNSKTELSNVKEKYDDFKSSLATHFYTSLCQNKFIPMNIKIVSKRMRKR